MAGGVLVVYMCLAAMSTNCHRVAIEYDVWSDCTVDELALTGALPQMKPEDIPFIRKVLIGSQAYNVISARCEIVKPQSHEQHSKTEKAA